uniref:MFS domain-containing protein n=1 Tax=Steinernema glaseri TaxID=37863 RepID=A0A1I8A321_9BILA
MSVAEALIAEKPELLLVDSIDKEDKDEPAGYLRYAILILATLCCSIVVSCNFVFNFAVVCGSRNEGNGTTTSLDFPNEWLRLLYSAFPLGNLILLPFISAITQRYSQRIMIAMGGFTTAIATLLIPLAYEVHPVYVIVLRFVQGIGMTPLIPLSAHVSARWTPAHKIGFFLAVMTGNPQIGIFFTMGLSGFLCGQGVPWQVLYYVHGFVALCIYTAWVIVFRDFPATHPWIKRKEIELILGEEHIHNAHKIREPTPYKAIFTNVSVLCVLIAAFGNFNGVSPVVVFSSTIIRQALGFSQYLTGFWNSLSFVMQFVLKLLGGHLSDVLPFSETNKLRFFNTISCGLSGVLMLMSAFVSVSHHNLCLFFVVMIQGVIGFNSAGFNKAGIVVARQHAHIVATVQGIIMCLGLVFEPFLVYHVAPDQSWAQWKYLFIGHGLVLIVTNGIYCIGIRGRPAPFTKTLPRN